MAGPQIQPGEHVWVSTVHLVEKGFLVHVEEPVYERDASRVGCVGVEPGVQDSGLRVGTVHGVRHGDQEPGICGRVGTASPFVTVVRLVPDDHIVIG